MGSDLWEVWLPLQPKQQYHSWREQDLAVLIFVEHIRKLTIKFICLFQFRFSNTVTISPLKGWDTLSVFLLTIYVSIEVSGISLNVTNQVTDIQIVLLFDIRLYFPSQSFKFWPKFTTASLFRFCMRFISSTNLPSYLRGYPRRSGSDPLRPKNIRCVSTYMPEQ